jgi:hypothetical protein
MEIPLFVAGGETYTTAAVVDLMQERRAARFISGPRGIDGENRRHVCWRHDYLVT